jgi:aminoglycoside phosphotransferase (APT) family kinase protein
MASRSAPTSASEGLARLLAPVLDEPVEIDGLTRLSGGASRETWAFTARAAGHAPRELIMRRDPVGRPGPPGSMAREAHAMRAAGAAGLPVPEVLADDDGTELGTAGLVMSRVPGETIARRILRDDEYARGRRVLAAELGAFLAGLHAVDPAEVPGLAVSDPLAEYRDAYLAVDDVSPTFEAAHRWLEANRPEPTGRVVVHGDFRLGNVIVGPEGLRAAIDWELVHLGDPMEDLGWLCVKAWRFGAPLPVAGVGTVDQLLDAYERVSGRAVDRAAFHWWQVQKTLQWGIICMGQAAAHLTGAVRSVELAAIGRRVAEQEWDLLELLAPEAWAAARADAMTKAGEAGGAVSDGAGSPEPGDRAPAGEARDDPGLYGRPTAAELLEAVGEYLSGPVMDATEGHVRFHARVAANVVGIVGRQLTLGPAHEARYRAGLAALDTPSTEALCEVIRAGDHDLDPGDLFTFLATSVRDRLAVANPRHLG